MPNSNGKKIYLVFACDAWKSRDSMRLRMATSSLRKLRMFVQKQISDEAMSYGDDDRRTPAAESALFRKDFNETDETDDFRNINGQLKYGFIDWVRDGEEV